MSESDQIRGVSFKLPAAVDEAIAHLAKQRRCSKSALLRNALQSYAFEGRPSVTAVADALVRPANGPVDSSTNAKHLRDYGRSSIPHRATASRTASTVTRAIRPSRRSLDDT